MARTFIPRILLVFFLAVCPYGYTQPQNSLMQLLDMSEQLDRADKQDLADLIYRVKTCTAKRDFECANANIFKAQKLARGNQDQRQVAAAMQAIDDEKRAMVKEEEDRQEQLRIAQERQQRELQEAQASQNSYNMDADLSNHFRSMMNNNMRILGNLDVQQRKLQVIQSLENDRQRLLQEQRRLTAQREDAERQRQQQIKNDQEQQRLDRVRKAQEENKRKIQEVSDRTQVAMNTQKASIRDLALPAYIADKNPGEVVAGSNGFCGATGRCLIGDFNSAHCSGPEDPKAPACQDACQTDSGIGYFDFNKEFGWRISTSGRCPKGSCNATCRIPPGGIRRAAPVDGAIRSSGQPPSDHGLQKLPEIDPTKSKGYGGNIAK